MIHDHFPQRNRNFIPALAFCDKDILTDPRVREEPGVPAYLVTVDEIEYRVTEVPPSVVADGRPGWAVFDTDGVWLGDKELQCTDRVVAQWVYPTAIQAVTMVLAGIEAAGR